MATLVSSIVDTDGTGDYTSLNAADADNFGATGSDLVANDEYVECSCIASSGSADGSETTISGYTTDSTRNITVKAGTNHKTEATWNTSKYRLSVVSTKKCLGVGQAYTLIKSLQVDPQSDGNYSCHGIARDGTGYTKFTIDSCYIRGESSTTVTDGAAMVGINAQGSGSDTVEILNCIIRNFTYTNLTGRGIDNSYATVKSYNNTIYNCDVGVLDQASPDCQNTIAVGCSTDFQSDCNGDYNISSDSSAPGTNSLTGQSATDLFTDPANGDFSLKSGSNAIDAGTDLSAEMDAVDIAGTSRPQGSAWDIGAFEYVVAGLTFDSISQSQGMDAPSLSQLSLLNLNNIAQSQSIDPVSLSQLHQLAVNALSQGQSLGGLTLDQIIPLAINAVNQSQEIDSPTISQVHQLAVNALSQGQSLGGLNLDQLSTLSIDEVAQAQTLDAPSISVAGEFVINSIAQGQSLSSPSLSQYHGALTLAAISQGQTLGSPALDQAHSIVCNNIKQGQSIDTQALDQLISLSIDAVTQGQTLDEPSFYAISVLDIDNVAQAQSIEATSISQVSQLIIDQVAQGQVIENVNFSVAEGRVYVTITARNPGVNFNGRSPNVKFH